MYGPPVLPGFRHQSCGPIGTDIGQQKVDRKSRPRQQLLVVVDNCQYSLVRFCSLSAIYRVFRAGGGGGQNNPEPNHPDGISVVLPGGPSTANFLRRPRARTATTSQASAKSVGNEAIFFVDCSSTDLYY
jgi:hypothetical protein